jgi:predicted aconitase
MKHRHESRRSRQSEGVPHRTNRCPHEDYETIKQAAALLGISTHRYTRDTLLARARQVIEESASSGVFSQNKAQRKKKPLRSGQTEWLPLWNRVGER